MRQSWIYDELGKLDAFMTNALHGNSKECWIYVSRKGKKKQGPQKLYENPMKFWVSCDRPMPTSSQRKKMAWVQVWLTLLLIVFDGLGERKKNKNECLKIFKYCLISRLKPSLHVWHFFPFCIFLDPDVHGGIHIRTALSMGLQWSGYFFFSVIY